MDEPHVELLWADGGVSPAYPLSSVRAATPSARAFYAAARARALAVARREDAEAMKAPAAVLWPAQKRATDAHTHTDTPGGLRGLAGGAAS
jgi:hypothetical protein